MSILLFLIVSYILLSLSLYKVFEKAGVEPKKALIPGINFAEWCQLIGRKPRYALWLLFPIVNIFIFCGMAVDLVRSFRKYEFKWSALAVIYAPLAFYLIGKNPKDTYDGPTLIKEREYAEKIQKAMESDDKYKLKKLLANNPYKKSPTREWAEAIVFAVFAAAFIRMFLIEAYVIPTPSMEGSLLVGDFLFVSKAHYGIRPPMTVAMVPLLHNTIPYLGTESYLKSPSLGYHRLPAISKIKNNDPIVFNYPEGDSVYVTPGRVYSIHDKRRQPPGSSLRVFLDKQKLRVRPIDKRDHYIKRCIGIPGDKVEIKDGQVFINDKELENSTYMQFRYQVQSLKAPLSEKRLEEWGVSLDDINFSKDNYQLKAGFFHLNSKQVEQLKSLGGPDEIRVERMKFDTPERTLFPHDKVNFPDWTLDNYGPIVIPKKGETVQLTPENIALYRRVIGVYDHNDFSEKGGKFFINGEEATSYTFKQDYYWAMGDNRHNSEDSRYWGYVPADHIVGKPLFIWFSTKNGNMRNGINWSRIFTSANKM